MKAFPIILNEPVKYKNHIIMIGSFHILCAYMKMIGNKMSGTGLSDILLESELMSCGSLVGVLTGKSYARAMNCHKVMLESLERLLFEKFLVLQGEDAFLEKLSEESRKNLEALVKDISNELNLLSDGEFMTNTEDYINFREAVRQGNYGKTSQLWLTYMDHVWLILGLIHSVKTNNFVEYAHSLYLMPDLFFSFGGHNNGCYLTFFAVFLANIESSHPGATEMLEQGAFSVARSFIPGNRSAVDKTIEETFMKHAKSRGGGGAGAGLSGILKNQDAFQKWTPTTSERTKYYQATLSLADMTTEICDGTSHKDLRKAETAKSERQVTKTIDAIKSFINPFDVEEHQKLYCLSSGAAVDTEVEDVLRAEKLGKNLKEAFIEERLKKQDLFFEPIKKPKLKSMLARTKPTKLLISSNKVVQYKQEGNAAFSLLVCLYNLLGTRLNLQELMSYPLTPKPYSIATADGFFAKTNKAKGMELLAKDVDNGPLPPDNETLVIEDGNAIFYYLSQVPGNFKGIAEKIFSIMVRKPFVIFSTDMYHPNSVKAVERLRREVHQSS